MLRGCLGAQEGAGGVDVEGFAPLFGGHGQGGHATDDAGEAEEVIERAERGDGGGDAFLHGGGVGYVDGDAEDATVGKVGGQRCYGGLGASEGCF